MRKFGNGGEKPQKTMKQVLESLAALCARGEKCTADLRKKAADAGMSEDEQEKIINYLVENKFVDDARYARLFASDRSAHFGWGKKKIELTLRTKGIAREIIAQAIEALPEDDYQEKAEAVVRAKAKTLRYKNKYDAKTKLMRFALSRGFEMEAVMPTINDIVKDIEGEDVDNFEY